MTDAQRPMILSAEEYRQQQIAQSKAEAATLGMDEGPVGGRYKVGDRWLDANGEPVKETAKAEPAKRGEG